MIIIQIIIEMKRIIKRNEKKQTSAFDKVTIPDPSKVKERWTLGAPRFLSAPSLANSAMPYKLEWQYQRIERKQKRKKYDKDISLLKIFFSNYEKVSEDHKLKFAPISLVILFFFLLLSLFLLLTFSIRFMTQILSFYFSVSLCFSPPTYKQL